MIDAAGVNLLRDMLILIGILVVIAAFGWPREGDDD